MGFHRGNDTGHKERRGCKTHHHGGEELASQPCTAARCHPLLDNRHLHARVSSAHDADNQ